MNYNIMAKEYEKSAKDISMKLNELKAKKSNCYGGELKELLHRIKILESMYIDCDFTAKVMYARALKSNSQEQNNKNTGVII